MDPIKKVLDESKTIAVVGASDDPNRPSHEVAFYLQERGYNIIPINPSLQELFGVKCYPSLLSVPDAIDVVDVFRRPEAVPAIVEEAIQKHAKVFWMQPGAENVAAAERAMEAGMEVIMGVCMMREHRVLGDE